MANLKCPECGRPYNVQALVRLLAKKGYTTIQIRNELFANGLLLEHTNPLASITTMVKRAKLPRSSPKLDDSEETRG